MVARATPIEELRRRLGGALMDGVLNGASRLARLHPRSRALYEGIEVLRDLTYRPGTTDRAHLMDVYRPVAAEGPLPVVLYVHGGGFRILSKDTHWMMALHFARRGFLVFNINYRLAPQNPFPAGLEDASAALRWVWEHAAAFGGDREHLVLAGESAGGNLVTALSIACAWERPEPYARQLFDAGITPRVVMPAAGLLQVSDGGRFEKLNPTLPAFIKQRIQVVCREVMGDIRPKGDAGYGLLDPLVVLETAGAPDRPLPPFFVTAGSRDPIVDDSRRLSAALTRHGVTAETRIYPGAGHAFHAVFWREPGVSCWNDHFTFLERHA